MDDFNVGAIKVGMLFSKDNVFSISYTYKEYNRNIPLVIDPVMISTSGNSLILDETIEAIKEFLFPIATIITPNLNEASTLLNKKIQTINEMEDGAMELVNEYGVNSVLIKGGHLEGNDMVDIFYSKDISRPIMFKSKKINTINTHGTGCTLSSAIAAFLAIGHSLEESLHLSKEYITQAIDSAKEITLGKGNGAVNHFFNPQKLIKK